MTTFDYEQLIIAGLRGLPEKSLAEIADFVVFVRQRVFMPQSFVQEQYQQLIAHNLDLFSQDEWQHLEDEFSNYEQQYPKE